MSTDVGTTYGINVHLDGKSEMPRFETDANIYRCIKIDRVTIFIPNDDPDASRMWLENLSAAIIDALKSYS